MRTLVLLFLAAVVPAALAAQASPYVPLDDPMLPAFEHLVARGDVRDPMPTVRPFRRADARRVLREARDTTAPLVQELLTWWAEPTIATTGDTSLALRTRVVARVGAQAGTQARRDLLRPGGEGNAWPYADVRLEGLWGPVTVVARPGIENRVKTDPDWPGRRDNLASGRLFEGYASLQTGPFRAAFGQQARNWGPVGLPGFPISDGTYRRDGWSFDIVTRDLQFTSYASQLADETDSTGAVVKRYFITKRLGARLSSRLDLALWEATVLQGTDRSFESAYANPFALIFATMTYGYGDRATNNMLGLDARWRWRGPHAAQLQFALDDFWYDDRDVNRDRFGFTLQMTGPVGRRAAYRASYSLTSAFALRAFNRLENFTDGGVGLGRNFPDNDQLTLQLSVPVRRTWLVTPELTRLRQGEGRLSTPYPLLPLDPATNPTIFLGVRETTWRAALGASGQTGRLQLLGSAGVHRRVNAGQVAGRNDVRFVAQATGVVAFGFARMVR